MIRKILQSIGLLFIFLLAACRPSGPGSTGESPERQSAIDLVCGIENQANCLSNICEAADKCPQIIALTNKAVFNFVKTHAECVGCNTPDFPPDLGIGKCIEYQVSEISSGSRVTFWVSDNCSFRYGSPSESRIMVEISSDMMEIEQINPPAEYIEDPLYCQAESDCYCLSGSGVPFTGCSNRLYAPLNWSGYFPGDNCVCVSNQCVEK